ncbi:MAG: hypothetical protein NDF55_03790 [archaeon GB-1867-005]|nr:hypothetical protein [Candidatus Culexmicrobium cathedralense]
MKLATRYLLSEYGGRVVTRIELVDLCERFRIDLDYFINHAIRYGYVVRILRGLYYVKTVEEFKLRKSLNPLRVLSLGMKRLGIKWYFGLYTALRLSGVTHEYYDVTFVISHSLFRPRPIKIAGENVRFVKIKPSLVNFGLVKRKELVYSDLEKTLLDFLYLSKYGRITRREALDVLREYSERASREKLAKYVIHYPKTIKEVLVDEGIL